MILKYLFIAIVCILSVWGLVELSTYIHTFFPKEWQDNSINQKLSQIVLLLTMYTIYWIGTGKIYVWILTRK